MSDYIPRYLIIRLEWRNWFVEKGKSLNPGDYIKALRERLRYDDNSLPYGCSREAISRWLNGKRGYGKGIVRLCNVFGLDWKDVCVTISPETAKSIVSSTDIGYLVKSICSQISVNPPHRMKPPQNKSFNKWIKESFINLNLIEIERLLSESLPAINYSELTNGPVDDEDQEDPDRKQLKLPVVNRVISIEQALEKHDNLFVYGDPGAGKTNVLTWIAVKCRDQELLSGYVPVFLEFGSNPYLKSGDDIEDVVQQMFTDSGISLIDYHKVLASDRMVFIFDAIDETPFEEQHRIQSRLERFRLDYHQCRFIFSSRLGSDFNFSDTFQNVLIAPLKPRQIRTFVHHWFAEVENGISLSEQMMKVLKDRYHKDVWELAQRPILLDLLCQIYKRRGYLPNHRFDTFDTGIDAMTRGNVKIDTNILELAILRKDDIRSVLGEIAKHFFVDEGCLSIFHIKNVKTVIRSCFRLIFDIPQYKNIPTQRIIQAIEKDNGLLVQWARNYCTFSHLTYQEYFVAKYLLDRDKTNIALEHIFNYRWRFVIGLISEDLSPEQAWRFFAEFKFQIDSTLAEDKSLHAFVERVQETSKTTAKLLKKKRAYPETKLRAWYFAYALHKSSPVDISSVRIQEFDLPEFEHATSFIRDNQLSAHDIIYDLYHSLNQEEMTPQKFTWLSQNLESKFEGDIRNHEVIKGWQALIRSQQANIEGNDNDAWWVANRDSWKIRIERFMESLNLPSVAGMGENQIKQLRDYYKATKLLSICINRSNLNDEQRGKVVDSMLMFGSCTSGISRNSTMISIFLAHATEDKEAVTDLYQRLKDSGFQPWLDQVDLLPGQNWRNEIPKAIQNSQVFIPCLSRQSVKKQGYVQREFKMALNVMADMPPGQIYLIPLRLDNCKIPELRQEEYGISLRDYQCVDLFKPDGYNRLVKGIRAGFANR